MVSTISQADRIMNRPMKALVKLLLASVSEAELPLVTILIPAVKARTAKMRNAMVMNHFNTVLKRTTRSHGEQLVPEHGMKP